MATTEQTREREIVDAVPKQLLIGGEWRDATVDDALAALGAAADTQAEWAKSAPRERGEVLRGAYERLVERADDLAVLMTLEMGKPVAESKAEVLYAADFLHWF